jgi:hypothetical protein
MRWQSAATMVLLGFTPVEIFQCSLPKSGMNFIPLSVTLHSEQS